MNRYPVGYEGSARGFAFVTIMSPVLHLMPAVLPQFSAPVGTYLPVYAFVADIDTFAS